MKNKYEIGAYVEYQRNDVLNSSIRISLIMYSEVWNEGLAVYSMINRDCVFEEEIIRELSPEESLIYRLSE